MTWYIVTGRLEFDDEDSLYTQQADTEEEACTLFEQQLREDSDEERKENRRECFINYIVKCHGPEKPEVVRAVQP